ncbi:methionyl-tRNA formyltransferase, partial [Streptomyces niveus]
FAQPMGSCSKNSVHIGTGSYGVELLWVQPQGKKPMRAADWARGVRIAPGERLGAAGGAADVG